MRPECHFSSERKRKKNICGRSTMMREVKVRLLIENKATRQSKQKQKRRNEGKRSCFHYRFDISCDFLFTPSLCPVSSYLFFYYY